MKKINGNFVADLIYFYLIVLKIINKSSSINRDFRLRIKFVNTDEKFSKINQN